MIPSTCHAYLAAPDLRSSVSANVWVPVLQEAVLAPRNICHWGDTEIALLDVLRGARWLWKHLAATPTALHDAVRYPAVMWSSFDTESYDCVDCRERGRASYLHHFMGFSLFSASDPRDHIYGLVGLHQAANQGAELSPLIRPDYSKPLKDVLRDATRYALELDRTSYDCLKYLDIVWQPAESSKYALGCVSWVLRWDVDAAVGLHDTATLNSDLECDGRPYKGQLKFKNDDPDVLSLSGFTVDTVGQHRWKVYDDGIIPDIRRVIRDMHVVLSDWLSRSNADLFVCPYHSNNSMPRPRWRLGALSTLELPSFT